MAGTQPTLGVRQRLQERDATGIGRPYGGRSLAERRTDERARLITAAAEAFASRGYAATSIENIVDGARVSKTAFYRWFSGKEDCLLEVFAAGVERLSTALEEVARSPGPPAHKVRQGVRVFVGALAADPTMARVVLIEAVGATPAVEEARFRTRAAFADLLVGQMRLASPWKTRSRASASVVALATIGGMAEVVSHLVAAHELERWESSIAPLSRWVLRALTPEGD